LKLPPAISFNWRTPLPKTSRSNEQAAAALESLAVTISQRDGYTTGGNDDAVDDLRKSIEYSKSALKIKPEDSEAISQLASSYNRLAVLIQNA